MILLWLLASFKNVSELVYPNLSFYAGALQNHCALNVSCYSLDAVIINGTIALGLFAGILKFCNWFNF